MKGLRKWLTEQVDDEGGLESQTDKMERERVGKKEEINEREREQRKGPPSKRMKETKRS